MPPRAKFTRDQITAVALDLICKEGKEALTARNLAKALHSSVCPIFTVFSHMDEVYKETIKAAKARYNDYIKKGLQEPLPFKGVGTQYILFAMEEPKLFQLLFMSEQTQHTSLDNILALIDESYKDILHSVQISYDLSKEDAKQLYLHLWIYTHGIASLCATHTCAFTAKEISERMSEVFKSLVKEYKGGSIA